MSTAIENPFLGFLVTELTKLHRSHSSGTFFATTIGGVLAQFGLDDGEIVFLSFQNSEGLDAVAALREQRVEVGTSRFAQGRHRGAVLSLPSTGELLAVLTKAAQAGGTAASRRETARGGRSASLTDVTRGIIEEELTEIGGPIAAMLCQELWDSGVTDVNQALGYLAKQLPDETQADQLRQNVLNRLKS